MSALIGHEALETALDWPDLIGQLRDWYRGKAVMTAKQTSCATSSAES